MEHTIYNKLRISTLVLSLLLLTADLWGRGALQTTVINGVEVEYSVPRDLTPTLSADGKTLYSGVPVKVYIADPVSPALPVHVAAPISVQSASSPSNKIVNATSTFSVTYIPNGGADEWSEPCFEFPSEAQAAFDAAVAIWESMLNSSVPITIRAGWADLVGGTLGYSGGGPLHVDFSGAPLSSTMYVGSLANSLAGSDLDSLEFDMHITYNMNFDWYFGTDGNTPAGKYDFMSVVLHEIAHGLNFSGTMEYTAGTGEWGYGSGYPGVYDTFMKDAGGINLLNTATYPNPSSALGTALTSESIWFHGPAAMAANGGQRVKIYAPSTWIGGSSYSHLDEATFAGTVNRLMVYSIPSGISIHDPGPVTSGMLTDMGWVLNNPNYPSNFVATTIDKFSIGLAWQKNSGDDDVLVAWSTNGTFGTPSGTYIVGNSISGGGTVLYKGSSTNKVHTGLTMGTEYFYKVWSDLSGGEYSLGKNAFAMTDYILSEGFENGGSVPSGWSHSYVVGTVDWEYRDGDGFSVNPAAAHSGSYNAYFYYDDYVDYKTKLITPEIDFGTSTTNTELKFWHYMEAWEGDQDELRVFYKTSAGGAWNQIATYTNTVSSWTEQTIMLPDANSTYYVAFEGNAMYGYGVCVDDITITGEELPLSTNSITASVVGDGAISPSGTVSVVEGGMTNFIITADARRHIASIQTNGAHIAGSPYSDNAFVATNYLWSNITMSGTIIASFDVNAIDVIIADIVTSNSNVIVEWVSSNGWLYMCESSDDLLGSPVVWSNVNLSWILSSGALMNVTDTNVWPKSQRFYRVQARP